MPLGRRTFQRRRDGRYRVRLSDQQRTLLRSLPDQLRELLRETPEDPSLVRLFPPAYPDDQPADEEYVRLVHHGLVDGKLRALATLEQTAGADELSEPELLSWLGAVEDLRLVLGTRLDVTEEHYGLPPVPDDPDAPLWVLYGWLSWLQEEIVTALAPDD